LRQIASYQQVSSLADRILHRFLVQTESHRF
jgi:hypothetical protein